MIFFFKINFFLWNKFFFLKNFLVFLKQFFPKLFKDSISNNDNLFVLLTLRETNWEQNKMFSRGIQVNGDQSISQWVYELIFSQMKAGSGKYFLFEKIPWHFSGRESSTWNLSKISRSFRIMNFSWGVLNLFDFKCNYKFWMCSLTFFATWS